LVTGRRGVSLVGHCCRSFFCCVQFVDAVVVVGWKGGGARRLGSRGRRKEEGRRKEGGKEARVENGAVSEVTVRGSRRRVHGGAPVLNVRVRGVKGWCNSGRLSFSFSFPVSLWD